MQAIGNEVLKNDPTKKKLYIYPLNNFLMKWLILLKQKEMKILGTSIGL